MVHIGLAHVRKNVIGGLLIPAFAGAQNEFQIVGHIQTGCCVKPFLACLAVAIVCPWAPYRLWKVAFVTIEIGNSVMC
ncbi:hypothetical protein D3C77_593610 [compost metagenome]